MAKGSSSSPQVYSILCAVPRPGLMRLLAGSVVKYVEVPSGVLPKGWHIDKNLAVKLPPLPLGGDRVFRLQRTFGTRCAFFPRTGLASSDLQGVDVTGVETGVKIDYLDLEPVRNLNEGRLSKEKSLYDDKSTLVRYPRGDRGQLMVRRIVSFPPSLMKVHHTKDRTIFMAREIRLHKKAAENGLAPRFLGLVTEPGRGVIGFLSEFVDGSVSAARHREDRVNAGIKPDVDPAVGKAILEATRRMHSLGILHHDLHLGNFLVSPDNKVRIIDFEYATWMDKYGCPTDEEGKVVHFEQEVTQLIEVEDIVDAVGLPDPEPGRSRRSSL